MLQWVNFLVNHSLAFGKAPEAPFFLLNLLFMLKTIFAVKQKMNQTFIEGTRVPVTWVKVYKYVVSQVKDKEKDGYFAVQLSFGNKKEKDITKPLKGHLSAFIKDGNAPRFLKEVRFDKKPDLKVKDVIDAFDVLKVGDLVSVKGVSKGKGFAGVVKRWGFAGGPKTHGQSDRQRAPGSIGQGTTPGRIHKGKKMAGRMGQDMVLVKNLVVVAVDEKENLIGLSGPVPGKRGDLLVVDKIASGKLLRVVKSGLMARQKVEQEESKDEAEKSEKIEGETKENN